MSTTELLVLELLVAHQLYKESLSANDSVYFFCEFLKHTGKLIAMLGEDKKAWMDAAEGDPELELAILEAWGMRELA